MTDRDELLGRLRALAAVLPRLESARTAEFGEWERSRQGPDGTWSMPYVEYGPLEAEFRRAATGWIRPDIDWPRWMKTPEAEAFRRDPALIAAASAEQLACLVTAIIRGDRFSEGNLLSAFETGHLAAIARRAGVLARELERDLA